MVDVDMNQLMPYPIMLRCLSLRGSHVFEAIAMAFFRLRWKLPCIPLVLVHLVNPATGFAKPDLSQLITIITVQFVIRYLMCFIAFFLTFLVRKAKHCNARSQSTRGNGNLGALSKGHDTSLILPHKARTCRFSSSVPANRMTAGLRSCITTRRRRSPATWASDSSRRPERRELPGRRMVLRQLGMANVTCGKQTHQ